MVGGYKVQMSEAMAQDGSYKAGGSYQCGHLAFIARSAKPEKPSAFPLSPYLSYLLSLSHADADKKPAL